MNNARIITIGVMLCISGPIFYFIPPKLLVFLPVVTSWLMLSWWIARLVAVAIMERLEE